MFPHICLEKEHRKVNIYTSRAFLILEYLQILTRHSVLVAYGDRRECELNVPMLKEPVNCYLIVILLESFVNKTFKSHITESQMKGLIVSNCNYSTPPPSYCCFQFDVDAGEDCEEISHHVVEVDSSPVKDNLDRRRRKLYRPLNVPLP